MEKLPTLKNKKSKLSDLLGKTSTSTIQPDYKTQTQIARESLVTGPVPTYKNTVEIDLQNIQPKSAEEQAQIESFKQREAEYKKRQEEAVKSYLPKTVSNITGKINRLSDLFEKGTEQFKVGAIKALPFGEKAIPDTVQQKVDQEQLFNKTFTPELFGKEFKININPETIGQITTSLASTAAQYGAVNKALESVNATSKLGALLGGSKLAKFGATQGVDFFADVIIQTPQEIFSAIENNDSLDGFVKTFLKNRGKDILANAIVGGVFELNKFRKLKNSNPKIAKEVVEKMPDGAKKVEFQNELGVSAKNIEPSAVKQTDEVLLQADALKPVREQILQPEQVGTPVVRERAQALEIDRPERLSDVLKQDSQSAKIKDTFTLTVPFEEQKLRKTIDNSLMRSQLPDEVKAYFKENPQTYLEISNQETWDKAFNAVKQDPDKILEKVYSKEFLDTADDTAETIALLHKLSNEGNYEESIKLATNFANKATEGGRAIQAISLLSKTTPEGKLVEATKIIERIKRNLSENFPDAYKALEEQGNLPKLSEADYEFIQNQMKKAQDLTGRPRDIEIAKVDQLLTDKIPPTLGDKFRAFRNISLLANFKTTLSRNPLGNIIFGAAENIAQIPSGITDAMVSKILKTQRQTPILPNLKKQATGFKKGTKEALEDIKLNIDTSPTRGGIELPRSRKVFEAAWLNKVNNWLGDALKLGDRPFYQAAYDMRLDDLKKLGVKGTDEELSKLAQEFALQRVFQNQGTTADILSTVKRGMNKAKLPGIDYGLGDIVMPYTQTPANILEKGLEYTPLNLINIGTKIGASGVEAIGKKLGKPSLIKAGAYGVRNNQKAFTDAVGRMFTGAGIMALGYNLAKNGFITGKDQTKGKERSLSKQLGTQQYSIKIGDTWYSYDWGQPAAIPLAVGVDFYNAGVKEDEFLQKIQEGTIAGGDTLFEQSLLRGIANLFGGQYGGPTEGILDAVTGSPTQFTSTFGSQIAQFTDPYKREVDYDKVTEQIQRRLPGARQQLPELLNMFGEPIREQDGRTGLERAFDVFVAPYRKQEVTKDPIILEINRLFQATKDTDVIPDKMPPNLTDEEERQFKIEYGQAIKQALENTFNGVRYTSSDDEQRAELVATLIRKVYNETKKDMNID